MEPNWDIGDGYRRWSRGIGRTKFLITLVRPEVMALVSGCHIKYVKLTLPVCEVSRMFHPGVEGIGILEGNPLQSVFAVADIARKPKISIYKFENEQDMLVSELKGCGEYEFRAIRFTKSDLLLALTGAPLYTISVWKWAQEHEILVVDCLGGDLHSDLIISSMNPSLWVEWSKDYLTLYELQAFSNNNVSRTEVGLPPSDAARFFPDPRMGNHNAIDILSVVWSHSGDLFLLDHRHGIHKLDLDEKVLNFLGTIDLEEVTGDIEQIIPYEGWVAVLMDTGTLLVLQAQDEVEYLDIKTKNKMEFTSRISKYIPNPCAAHPRNSFYALTDMEKRVECVLDGKMRTNYSILDLTLSEIQSACFIERDAKYVAVVSERGGIYILDSDAGNLHARWKLPLFAEVVLCHPLVPILAVGTADGCIVFVDIKNLKTPKILYKSYLHEEAEIDRMCFTSRARHLVCGDSQRGHLFLCYGYPSLEFHYLDYHLLGAVLSAINVPSNYKDFRLQVLLREREGDEVPYQLNNYKLECDTLELVASQLFDVPMTTMCFASFKQLLYSFSCEPHSLGMTLFTNDMQAGSLKEPDITFEGDFQLDVNRILLVGDRLYSFGEDGCAMIHVPPAPRAHVLQSESVIKTHFSAYGGIVEGFLSMDGTRLIAMGRDRSIVHIQLRPPAEQTEASWNLLGWGPDILVISQCQMKYYETMDLDKNTEIGVNEQSAQAKALADAERILARRSEKDVKNIKAGLDKLRVMMKNLLELNESREPSEQLTLDEFEVDEEDEELAREECEQDKQIAQIIVQSIIEERYNWVAMMKAMVWDQFIVKSSRIKGFNYKREISNYPLLPVPKEELDEMEVIRQERRIEKRLLALENKELTKVKDLVISRVAQFRKKRKVKKKKKRSAGGNKFGMRGMAQDDSDSDSDEAPKKNAFEELMVRTPPDEPDDEPTDDEADDEEANDGEEGAGVDEEEDAEGSEVPSRTSSRNMNRKASSQTSSKGLNAAASGSVMDLVEADDPPSSPPTAEAEEAEQALSLKTLVRGGTKRERRKSKAQEVLVEEVEEEVEAGTEDDADDDLDVVEEDEVDYVRKKKRRMAWRRLHEDDEDLVLVEESDSSDESESDIERQILRDQTRIREMENKMSKAKLSRYMFLKVLYSGSLTYELFEPNPLLYDQLELSNFNQIRCQMKVVASEIRKLKIMFNEAFEDARGMKAYELNVIQKRNERIREITTYFNINIPTEDPENNVFEHPESCFEVKDEEVPVPKYMTEEERRLAEIARLEEEARRLAKSEDFRERALITMMDGVLETRREDVLKRDIPKPPFMVNKEQWEWNQEEYAKANEYYKKVEELEKQRNEFRRELETEIRGLLRANSETKGQFDARMKKLYEFKVEIETSVRMEEVKMCRMVRQVMRRYELDKDEEKLGRMLRKLQETMKSTQSLASQLVARVDSCSQNYEAITDREKNLERTFRNDLGEVGHFYDVFTKLYKKRPRINMKTDKATELLSLMVKGLGAQNLRKFGQENGALGKSVVEAIMELDEPMQNPIGCPRSTWDRFCRLRREKISCEYQSKLVGHELMTLKGVLDSCKGREDEVGTAMATVLTNLARQREHRLAHIHNVEFQMVVDQGQVELPRAMVRADFYNALLLKKDLVQACNVYIKKYGGIKLAALQRSKIQHRNVKQIEWNFKRVHLKEKHLIERKRDINLLRVTKEVLEFLRLSDDFAMMQQRRLERIHKLQSLAELFHRRFMGDQMKILHVVERNIQVKMKDSETKEGTVEKRNLQVSTVKSLCNVQNPEVILAYHKERMHAIMRSAFLMRRIAKNAEEIFFLETELERVYKKTYPIL